MSVQTEKLVRDGYADLRVRIASTPERRQLLFAKLREELEEVENAADAQELVAELGDLVEVCFAIGGRGAVEHARLAKRSARGGFDRGLVMRLADRTDK